MRIKNIKKNACQLILYLLKMVFFDSKKVHSCRFSVIKFINKLHKQPKSLIIQADIFTLCFWWIQMKYNFYLWYHFLVLAWELETFSFFFFDASSSLSSGMLSKSIWFKCSKCSLMPFTYSSLIFINSAVSSWACYFSGFYAQFAQSWSIMVPVIP